MKQSAPVYVSLLWHKGETNFQEQNLIQISLISISNVIKMRVKFITADAECPVIKDFWKEVADYVSCIIYYELPLHPNLCILGMCFFAVCNSSNATEKMLYLCFLWAKHTTAVL